jgi:quercetin dioxygenase-like cupin family protein
VLWGRTPGEPLTLSWTVNPRTLDEIDGLVAAGRKLGYRHFNVKVAPDPSFDLELCRRVRRLAPDSFLWADANCGYDPETALRMAPKLADAGVDAFEAPIRPNRIAGYQALARQRALPILMDEGLLSPVEMVEFIRLGMLDGVAMKPARCGGLLAARRPDRARPGRVAHVARQWSHRPRRLACRDAGHLRIVRPIATVHPQRAAIPRALGHRLPLHPAQWSAPPPHRPRPGHRRQRDQAAGHYHDRRSEGHAMRNVRDVVIGCAAAIATLAAMGMGTNATQATPTPQTDSALMDSAVFRWDALAATPNANGTVRRVVRARTATLDELESHITTLDPGKSPHPPHQHPNEELIIVKEGTLEAYVEGAWVPAPTGAMIFFASNHPHSVRNVGTTPATYYVVNWSPPGLKEKTASSAR